MRKKQGGKRENCGRKKANYQTKTVAFRLRLEWVEEIKSMVKNKLNELRSSCEN